MFLGRVGARAVLALASLAACAALASAPAWAEAPTTICVPEASSKQVLSTNTKGECPSKTISKVLVKYKSEALPSPAELEKLDKLLPHMNYVESGVGGKPTIQFSGVNVQVVNGEGKTATKNGAGNLVIGYDENPGAREQTGSHNLVLGFEESFASWSGIVDGKHNTISGPIASVLDGEANTSDGLETVVSGGEQNVATGPASWIGAGSKNATGEFADASAIFGGKENKTTALDEAIP